MNLAETMQRWTAQSPEALLGRASETLPFWVSLLLVIGIGYYCARLIWLLVPGPAPAAWTPPPPVAAAAPAASAGSGPGAYAAVGAAHLFGQAAAEPAPGLANAANAPETQLQLQLRGAVAALDERFAHAIIADSAGNEKVYFIKDPLPGGAVLQQVQADRVILSRGGALEALLLPRLSTGGSAGGPRTQAPQPLARRPATPSMQEAVSQNAATITEIIRPQPFMPNGELKGYRVYPGRNREQFVALGLKPGDLVTEINGMALNNPAQAMETFRSLANTTQVTVTVDRDGQSQTLTLDSSQVAAAGEGPAGGAASAAAPGAATTPAAAGQSDATPAAAGQQ
ncbi:Type II secretion system protein C [Gammaproteobacteria bacterium]|nr:type II secretion system protein GspC [Gammaproteobacteria bacterium]QOJ31386.1 MAG: type II secretion system protein GspC [Gammaproteobacteria bacterium]CAG0943041.1 Type II secretion system protein C [Gammaproteobacteria bacterium]